MPVFSFVNHGLRHSPEIRPQTGQSSAFSFDSPALTAVTQIMGSPGLKSSSEVT